MSYGKRQIWKAFRNMMVLLIVIVLFGTFLGCGKKNDASPTIRYIQASVSGMNITNAARTARSGDFIVLDEGTYSEATTGEQFPIVAPSGVHVVAGKVFARSGVGGSMNAPVGWMQNGFMPLARGTVVIDYDSQNQAFILAPQSDVSIERLEFRSSSGKATVAIEGQGLTNLTIRDNLFFMPHGILLDGSRDSRIEGNVFYTSEPMTMMSSPVRNRAITLWSSDNVTVARNTISSFDQGILIERSTKMLVEENIVVRCADNIGLDTASVPETRIEYNDTWLTPGGASTVGIVNVTTRSAITNPGIGHISADPLFVNREGLLYLWSSSPCATAGRNGGIIGAGSLLDPSPVPTITKSLQNTSVLAVSPSAELLRFSVTNGLFAPGLRIFVYVNVQGNAPIPLILHGYNGIPVGEEDLGAPFRPAIRTLIANNIFPTNLTGISREFTLRGDTSGLVSGDAVEVQVLSAEWVYGKGERVNDGFTPNGLPAINTLTVP